MLQLEKISRTRANVPILEEVSLTINSGDRIGLTGPNGCGKTTLINIMAGLDQADGGQITKKKNLEIGLLPQEILPGNPNYIMEEVLSDFPEYKKYKEMILFGPEFTQQEEFIKLQEQVELKYGFDVEARAFQILDGLGFDKNMLKKRMNELSGGFRMRVLLGRLLLKAYDLVLLDEPTNHLDLESILWLEQYLDGYSGAIVMISHDRYFLNRFATRIAHLERTRLTIVNTSCHIFTSTPADSASC